MNDSIIVKTPPLYKDTHNELSYDGYSYFCRKIYELIKPESYPVIVCASIKLMVSGSKVIYVRNYDNYSHDWNFMPMPAGGSGFSLLLKANDLLAKFEIGIAECVPIYIWAEYPTT